MTHIAGFERDQLLLLPEAVDDYVGVGQSGAVHRRLRRRAGSCGGGVRAGRGEGDGASRLCAGRSAEALHLRLSEPGSIEPAAGAGSPAQYRGHLAVARPQAGLQDHRRFPTRQSRGVSRRVPPVRAAVPAARPVRPRVAGGRRNPHQGGQQQGSQLHPLFAAKVHPRRRRAVGGLPQAARRGRCRGWRDKRRRAHEEPGREDRGAAARSAAATKRCWQSSNEPARTRSR